MYEEVCAASGFIVLIGGCVDSADEFSTSSSPFAAPAEGCKTSAAAKCWLGECIVCPPVRSKFFMCGSGGLVVQRAYRVGETAEDRGLFVYLEGRKGDISNG